MPPARAVPALALVLVTTPLLGCIGADDAEPTGATAAAGLDWVFQDFIVDDHDHGAAADHAVAAPTMHALGHLALGDDGKPYSYIGEMDTRDGRTAIAIVGRGSTPGFALLNTSDPSNPTVIGRGEAPSSYAVDVKLAPGGEFVFLATQQIAGGRVGGVPDAEGLTTGSYAARNGILLYHAAPELHPRPEIVGFTPVEPAGCHMLSVAEIGSDVYVFCIGASLTAFRFDTAPFPALVPVGVHWPFGTEGYDLVVGDARILPGVLPHDMTFQPDPLDGTPMLTVSHWDLGVVVLDVSDPALPRQVLRWTGEGASEYHGYVHSAQLAALDGVRYLVASPETLSDVLPAIWAVDVTDWSAPALVAEWINPGRHTSQGLLMTTHQWQIVDGRLYMAYNHNGVWVLDLATIVSAGGSTPDAREVLGVYLPHPDVELYDPDTAVVPNVWDINVVDGRVLASDRYTGLHVLHLASDPKTAEVDSHA